MMRRGELGTPPARTNGKSTICGSWEEEGEFRGEGLSESYLKLRVFREIFMKFTPVKEAGEILSVK